MDIAQHYNDLAAKHGASWPSSDASSLEALEARWRVLEEAEDLDGKDVLEVGCGVGLFGAYLTERHPTMRYTGIDVAERAIEEGHKAFPALNLLHADLWTFDPGAQYDVVLAQGVFYLLPDPKSALEMIAHMMRLSKRTVAFTAIDTWGGPSTQGELRIDPAWMLGWLGNHTHDIAFRHDYGYDSLFVMRRPANEV